MKVFIERFGWTTRHIQPEGMSGGLTLWWIKEVTVHIIAKDKNHIDCRVTRSLLGGEFFITWVYGDPVFSLRKHNWDVLRGIGRNRDNLWMCIGDFNDIRTHAEKVGGRTKGK